MVDYSDDDIGQDLRNEIEFELGLLFDDMDTYIGILEYDTVVVQKVWQLVESWDRWKIYGFVSLNSPVTIPISFLGPNSNDTDINCDEVIRATAISIILNLYNDRS